MENATFSDDDSPKKDGVAMTTVIDVDGETPKKRLSSAASSARGSTPSTSDKKPPGLAQVPYSGMGKEDLLRFSQTPFWNRLRLIFLAIFWIGWISMIVAVIILTILSPRCQAAPEPEWWQKSVMYQIYVRSFYDSNNDGIGDINGIAAKLGYLKNDLLVDTLVLSSVFKSQSNANGKQDFGYDIVDYKNIQAEYGTINDFVNLITAVHNQGMKLIVDFVPNHTGTEHPWFVGSSSSADSQTNPYWNYYVWEDCGVTEPTNWLSVYGGSVWTNSTPGNRPNCYLHQFLPQQPDLNLRSTAVRNELEGVLRFWLDHGVDGFRVTSSKHLFEDSDLRDEGVICSNLQDYNCRDHIYTTNQPEIYELISSWRDILEEYSNETRKILLTDAMASNDVTVQYYGRTADIGAQLPLNYGLGHVNTTCYTACIKNIVWDWTNTLPAFATSNWLVSTQDIPRLSTNVGEAYSKAMLMLMMTLPGVAVSYYGEEIGMINGNVTNPSVDPAGDINLSFSRDKYRSPMQWMNDVNAGFSNSTPYLPVNTDYVYRNVQDQLNEGIDSYTIINVYKNLAELHRDELALNIGYIRDIGTSDASVLAYIREFDGTNRVLVTINFGTAAANNVRLTDAEQGLPKEADIVITTHSGMNMGGMGSLSSVDLKPGEGIVFRWSYSR